MHEALRNVRAVIFDVGGTLVHPDWQRLAGLVEAETGMLFTPARLDEAFYAMLQLVNAQLRAGLNSKTARRAHWVFLDTFRSLGMDEAKCLSISEHLTVAHQERHLWCQPDAE